MFSTQFSFPMRRNVGDNNCRNTEKISRNWYIRRDYELVYSFHKNSSILNQYYRRITVEYTVIMAPRMITRMIDNWYLNRQRFLSRGILIETWIHKYFVSIITLFVDKFCNTNRIWNMNFRILFDFMVLSECIEFRITDTWRFRLFS